MPPRVSKSARVKKTVVMDRLLVRLAAGDATYAELHNTEQVERIAAVREGVPASIVTGLVRDLSISRERFYRVVGLSRATIDRKVKQNVRLDRDESEAVLGIARLIGQVEQMVHESGRPEGFDAARWLAAWLERPLAPLGGVRPAELMDTEEGRDLVSSTIARMQSGAYA